MKAKPNEGGKYVLICIPLTLIMLDQAQQSKQNRTLLLLSFRRHLKGVFT